MTHPWTWAVLTTLGLAIGAAPLPGLATTTAPFTATSAAAPKHKPKKAKTPKPPPPRTPGETPVERDKRLQRECKGKPNAGACEGYGI